MKKILILSDTHGNTDIIEQILDNESYDIAIHAGDYECDLKFIKKYFDYHVGGNNDFDSNQKELFFEIENKKFYLAHGHQLGSYLDLDTKSYMEKYLNQFDVDVLIHGHTHINKIWNFNNKFIVNPGSTTYPRGKTKSSYIRAIIKDDKLQFEIIELKKFGRW